MSTLAGAAGKVTKADLQASARVLVNRVTGKQETRPESIIELKRAVSQHLRMLMPYLVHLGAYQLFRRSTCQMMSKGCPKVSG